jgi:hypothetical protein
MPRSTPSIRDMERVLRDLVFGLAPAVGITVNSEKRHPFAVGGFKRRLRSFFCKILHAELYAAVHLLASARWSATDGARFTCARDMEIVACGRLNRDTAAEAKGALKHPINPRAQPVKVETCHHHEAYSECPSRVHCAPTRCRGGGSSFCCDTSRSKHALFCFCFAVVYLEYAAAFFSAGVVLAQFWHGM